jgi:hypothetical protein
MKTKKHGVFYIDSSDGGYYEVWVRGDFIGTEYNGGSANWLFSFYKYKARG